MPERRAASEDREDRRARRDSEDRSDRGDRAGRRRRAGGSGLPAGKAAKAGLQSIVELIGKQPEGVTSVERTEDGWLVGVEMLEDQRIPSSSDVLALYEAELDDEGTLISYRRTRRYSRGRGDSEGG